MLFVIYVTIQATEFLAGILNTDPRLVSEEGSRTKCKLKRVFFVLVLLVYELKMIKYFKKGTRKCINVKIKAFSWNRLFCLHLLSNRVLTRARCCALSQLR